MAAKLYFVLSVIFRLGPHLLHKQRNPCNLPISTLPYRVRELAASVTESIDMKAFETSI